jgi:ankyrin repeat protein
VVAAKAGVIEAVRPLLERADLGIDERSVERPSGSRVVADMSSALHKAVGDDHLDLVELLVEWGAHLDAYDAQGRTAFDSARDHERTDTNEFLQVREAMRVCCRVSA